MQGFAGGGDGGGAELAHLQSTLRAIEAACTAIQVPSLSLSLCLPRNGSEIRGSVAMTRRRKSCNLFRAVFGFGFGLLDRFIRSRRVFEVQAPAGMIFSTIFFSPGFVLLVLDV